MPYHSFSNCGAHTTAVTPNNHYFAGGHNKNQYKKIKGLKIKRNINHIYFIMRSIADSIV
jgi:hypothetical protein